MFDKYLLIVITTHDKYTENHMLNRCIESIFTHMKGIMPYTIYIVSDSVDNERLINCIESIQELPVNCKDLLIENSKSLKLGVTQSRLKGYIYSKIENYKWITFIDSDAYFDQDFNIDDLINTPEQVSLISTYYGYHNKDTGKTIQIEQYNTYDMSMYEFMNKLYSEDFDTRDYCVFMGRFFRISTLTSDMFVDTKMMGDDGLFYLIYCMSNLNKRVQKVESRVLSDMEQGKGLAIDYIETAEKIITWTITNGFLSGYINDKRYGPILTRFGFQVLLRSNLTYRYAQGILNEETAGKVMHNYMKLFSDKVQDLEPNQAKIYLDMRDAYNKGELYNFFSNFYNKRYGN